MQGVTLGRQLIGPCHVSVFLMIRNEPDTGETVSPVFGFPSCLGVVITYYSIIVCRDFFVDGIFFLFIALHN